MQLVVGRLAVPPLTLAPAYPGVRLLDELMEPTEPRVRVGVEDRLEGGVTIFEGQYLAGALPIPVISVREHELPG